MREMDRVAVPGCPRELVKGMEGRGIFVGLDPVMKGL